MILKDHIWRLSLLKQRLDLKPQFFDLIDSGIDSDAGIYKELSIFTLGLFSGIEVFVKMAAIIIWASVTGTGRSISELAGKLFILIAAFMAMDRILFFAFRKESAVDGIRTLTFQKPVAFDFFAYSGFIFA